MAMTFFDPARNQSFTTPSPMGDRGRYHYLRKPPIRQNGRGDVIVSDYDIATWQWDWMLREDYLWWIMTLLNGANSLRCTGNTQVYTHTMDLTTTITQLIVHRPTYAYHSNGIYENVEVKFSHILW